MELWMAAVMAVASLFGGIVCLVRRKDRKIMLAAGIALLLVFALCLLYCAAALVLLGGIT